MLRYLRIRDLAVVADVEIRFGPGLNLLTGETGAGKSIVVDALGLILGDRASSGLLRSGASRSVLEAAFSLEQTESVVKEVAAAGIETPVEEAAVELVVRREISTDGSRCFVNGSPATVGMLRRIGDRLVDIHGQHEHLSLLDPRQQLEALDDFGGFGDLREGVRECHEALVRSLDRLNGFRRDREGLEERLEVLRYRLQAFESVAPRPGEDEELHRERERLTHSARIVELGARSQQLLEGDDGAGILENIRRVEEMVRELVEYVPELSICREELAAARLNLEEAAMGLRGRDLEVSEDPDRLEQVEARLSALAELARRHGGSVSSALEARDRARLELEELEAAAGDPEALARDVARCAEKFADLAARLSMRRKRAASRLAGRLAAELEALAMESTAVEFRVERREDGDSPVCVAGRPTGFDSRGIDRVELWIAANPGEEPRPLARAASGGELSRIMLALECARLGGKERAARRMVFDEVDAGIGGRVAAVVGERLHRISRERQVLCVTHLAQIASRADRHLVVEKIVENGRTRTGVRNLDSKGRLEEVARMLGGARITDATKRHAREMIGSVGREGKGA